MLLSAALVSATLATLVSAAIATLLAATLGYATLSYSTLSYPSCSSLSYATLSHSTLSYSSYSTLCHSLGTCSQLRYSSRKKLPKRAFRARLPPLSHFEAENRRFPASFSFKTIFTELKYDFCEASATFQPPRLLTRCHVCAALPLRSIKAPPSPRHKMLPLPRIYKMHQHKVLRLPRKTQTLPPRMSQNATKTRYLRENRPPAHHPDHILWALGKN